MKDSFYLGAVSTVLPRGCGIATFNGHFIDNVNGDLRVAGKDLFPIVRTPQDYDLPHPGDYVRDEIIQQESHQWGNALDVIVDLSKKRRRKGLETGIILQHEYGIFNSSTGAEGVPSKDESAPLLKGFRENSIPNITVLHTLLNNPNEYEREVMEEIVGLTDRVIVMTPSGVDILKKRYGAPEKKIDYIPHGVSRIDLREDREELKENFGFEGKYIISTSGFISPRKTIENPIDAFGQLKKSQKNRDFNLTYLVVGMTHPEIQREHSKKHNDPEFYRHQLMGRAENLGLKVKDLSIEHLSRDMKEFELGNYDVVFLKGFLEDEDWARIMEMSDLGLIPNDAPEQISSGPISEWVGMGRQFVATASPYAIDMHKKYGAGFIVEPNNPDQIRETLENYFFTLSPAERIQHEGYAAAKGVEMDWKDTARRTVDKLKEVVSTKADIRELSESEKK